MIDPKTEPTAAEGLQTYLEQRRCRRAGEKPKNPARGEPRTIPNGDPDCEEAIRALEQRWEEDTARGT